MGLEIRQVATEEDLAIATRVAGEIWNEYWPAIIGQAQTDYMVATMQSLEAIRRDIFEKGYLYYLLVDDEDEVVGYSAALPEDFIDMPEDPRATQHGRAICEIALRRLFISKIYLYASARGKHYASRMIEFYEELCRENDFDAMYLTVNIHNELGIRAYLGRGFEIIEDLAAPIGEGFVMDDHIMAKRIPPIALPVD